MKFELFRMENYLTPTSYGDVRLDETRPDLLADSPPPSPVCRHHPHPHHLHHHQQQQHAATILDQQLLRPQIIPYTTQSHGLYNTVPEAETISHFEYGDESMPDLIPKPPFEMRAGNVGGEGSGRRGPKRKGEDKYEETDYQNKMDVSQRCDVCGEQASGHYFGALVCLPCKSFFIRCTKDGRPNFNNQCGGKCDVLKGGRVRCQHCRFQKCISAGMYRKEKPEAVEPAEGQVLCKVCGDIANGVHFGVTTCEGCKKFFRRGLKENKTYSCKGSMRCSINPRMRNNCRYCRYQKCMHEGMSREAIKMGRPKKGDLCYRKPGKKIGMKLAMRDIYSTQTPEAVHLSISSESDQDEEPVTTPGDGFDPMSSAQHLHLQQDTPQFSNHIQHLHLHHHYQQQQQQPGTFSLGSILHECMTVRDWDQKVEMSDLSQEMGCSQPVAMTSSSSSSSHNGPNTMDECGQMSPHVRQSSPTMLSDMLGRQLHPQQHHHQPQHGNVLQQLPGDLHMRRQNIAYDDQSAGNLVVINGVEFSNENIPINKTIKTENVSLQGVHGYVEDVMEDVKNPQTFGKPDYQTYQGQGVDLNTPYGMVERAGVSSNSMLMPMSQVGPTTGSQVIAINVTSNGVLYTGQGHQESTNRDLNQQQQAYDLVPIHRGLHQSNMDHESVHDDSNIHIKMDRNVDRNIEYNQGTEMTDLLPSGVGHNIVTDHRAVRNTRIEIPYSNTHNVATSLHIASSQSYTSAQHQFASNGSKMPTESNSPLVFESLRPRNSGNVFEDNCTVLSFSGQNTATPVPSSLAISSDVVNSRHKFSGIRNPLAAILQQHRAAIQAGKPFHLSSDEVEELLNTFNSEQKQTQGSLTNEHIQLAGQRVESFYSNVDRRRQETECFVVKTEKQPLTDEQEHGNRQIFPYSTRGYSQSSGQINQYHNSSPITQSVIEVNRRHYHSQMSSSSSSSCDARSTVRHEISTGYNNINNNNVNYNNNNIQINNYTSRESYNGPDNANCSQDEVCEDSFNSALVRGSTQLHGINRIFLAIENSCDAYGCNNANTATRENSLVDRATALRVTADDFSPETSHRYWHGFEHSSEPALMTPDRQRIICDVLDAFDDLQMTYVTNEPEYMNVSDDDKIEQKKTSLDQIEHWHHIQRRIARHVVAGQRFCRNIPGYFKLDIQDRISLGKHVGFGLMVLIACTEFYDPDMKRFKHIWNWTIPMQNPLFSYKIHLLSLGDRIHDINVDRTEVSMMCAISMTSIDCPNLLKPEIVCVVRHTLIDALKAHILNKTGSTMRLKKLMSIMPQVRLMTVWYNNLMKKMSLPSEVINGKITKPKTMDEENIENTSNISRVVTLYGEND